MQDELQTTIEELQTSNEEHKASNEEITSINEELQSSNEELETSKEEMQSLNEELTTVNAQLSAKAEQLQSTSNDLSALLHSTTIAVLFLDLQGRIRKYTPAAVELLELIPGDVGRPLSDLQRKFEDPDLEEAIRQVLGRLVPLEREVTAANERLYLRRVLPYRTTDNRIDGVVVTFIDITDRRQAEQGRIAAREYAEKIVATLHEPLLVLNPDLTVKSVNAAFYSSFQVEEKKTIGTKIYDLGNGQWNIPALRILLEEVLPADQVFNDYEVRHDFEDLGHRVMLLNGRRLDHLQLILIGIRDVTEQQEAQEQLRASEQRFRLMVQSVQGHAIFMMDPQGNVASWNEGAQRILGYTEKEAIGKPASRFFTEEDQQNGLPEKELTTARVMGKASDESWLVRKDGDRFWASGATTAICGQSGELQGYAKIFQDLTERRANEMALRQSELRLRIALSAARMGTWVWNLLDNSEVLDESLHRLLGLTDGKTIDTFDEFLTCIHPNDQAAVAAAFHQSIASKRPLDVEFRVKCRTGMLCGLKTKAKSFRMPPASRLYLLTPVSTSPNVKPRRTISAN